MPHKYFLILIILITFFNVNGQTVLSKKKLFLKDINTSIHFVQNVGHYKTLDGNFPWIDIKELDELGFLLRVKSELTFYDYDLNKIWQKQIDNFYDGALTYDRDYYALRSLDYIYYIERFNAFNTYYRFKKFMELAINKIDKEGNLTSKTIIIDKNKYDLVGSLFSSDRGIHFIIVEMKKNIGYQSISFILLPIILRLVQ